MTTYYILLGAYLVLLAYVIHRDFKSRTAKVYIDYKWRNTYK